jgi:hypothetical protein
MSSNQPTSQVLEKRGLANIYVCSETIECIKNPDALCIWIQSQYAGRPISKAEVKARFGLSPLRLSTAVCYLKNLGLEVVV